MTTKINKQCKKTLDRVNLIFNIFAIILFIVFIISGIYFGYSFINYNFDNSHKLCEDNNISAIFCNSHSLYHYVKPISNFKFFCGTAFIFIIINVFFGLIGFGLYNLVRIR